MSNKILSLVAAAALCALSGDAAFAQPVNDSCSNPTALALGITSGSNVGATSGPEAPYFQDMGIGTYQDVWYSFTPPVGGYLEITLTADFWSSVVAVGGCTGSGFGITGTAFYPPSGKPGTCYVTTYAGSSVRLAVGTPLSLGGPSTQGTFTLDASFHPYPANDNASGAFPISPGLVQGSTWYTSNGVSWMDPLNDVWFSFAPPMTGMVYLTLNGPGTYWTGYNHPVFVDGGMTNEGGSFPVTAGQPFTFAVAAVDAPFGWGYGFGDFAFQFDYFPPAPNDECSGAFPIATGTTLVNNFTSTTSGGACVLQNDVWFTWVAPFDGTMSASGASFAAFDGSCAGALLACGPGPIAVPVSAGQTILLAAGGSAEDYFHVFVDCHPAPPNDECSGALPLAGYSTSGTTKWAIPGPLSSSCSATGSDVWYRLDVPYAGIFTASLCSTAGGSSPSDSVLAAFSGACGSLTELACSDNACGTAPEIALPVAAGQSIWIAVATKGAQGAFHLKANLLTNDDLSSALPISEGLLTGSNLGATTAVPPSACPSQKEVWFDYRPSATGLVDVNLCTGGGSAEFDTVLAAFTDAFGPMAAIACDDDTCGSRSRIQFPALAGQRILLSLGSKTGATGQFTLSIQNLPQPVKQTEVLALEPAGVSTTLARINTFPPERTNVGATGVAGLTGMEAQPATGTLFAVTSGAGTSTLYTIDPMTAAPTLIGSSPTARILGLAFDPAGTLFGSAGFSPSPATTTHLVRIDTVTGAVTTVGPFVYSFTLAGLAAHPASPTQLVGSLTVGVLGVPLFAIDAATGAASPLPVPLNAASGGNLPTGNLGLSRVTSGSSGLLLASPSSGTASGKLLAIDLATNAYYELGRYGAIAFTALAAPCPVNDAYGAGCPGAGDVVPLLAISGCTRPGSTATIRISQGAGGAPTLLAFGSTGGTSPLPGGCSLLVGSLTHVLVGPVLAGIGPGAGSFTYSTTIPASLVPASLFIQAILLDPAAVAGFSATNALAVAIE